MKARQAGRALFLSISNFILTYCPGSQNVKSDALSSVCPGLATRLWRLSFLQRVWWICWTILHQIVCTHQTQPGCRSCSGNIPPSSHSTLASSGLWRSSSVSGGGASVRTQVPLWTPLSVPTTRPLIAPCWSAASPAYTSHPWSYIALDFITGVPSLEGNTVILTIMDRFSKSVYYVALPELPSALKTTELFVSHVFRLHGISLDIVSD